MNKARQYKSLLDLFKKYLGKNRNVVESLGMIGETPEFIEIYFAELDMAINIFNKFLEGYRFRVLRSGELINASYLRTLLPAGQKLPLSEKVISDLTRHSELAEKVFLELGRFKFIEKFADRNKLFAALIVAIYRTYMLVKYPYLGENSVQVASSLEEMLAILALEGKKSHLFQATRHWIADYKMEGFSKELAEKIAKL